MKIAVLMSTYNGEKYIREQLDSILQQSVVQENIAQVQVVIRDDGSQDETCPIVETYVKDGSRVNIVVEKGENVGVKASFFELIKNAPEADYYAFSDQDDVWLEDKLKAAVKQIQVEEQSSGSDMPILYCGDTYLVDDNLQIIKRENKNPRPSFGNALVENICTGCTAVVNRALLELIQANIPNPNNIVMHDWWLYLMSEAYGKTIFDSEPHMYYRQHGNNEWGVKTSKIAILRYRLKRLFAGDGGIYRQLEELEKCYDDGNLVDAEKRCLVTKVLKSEKSIVGKCRLVSDMTIYRNSRDRDRVYRFAVMVGKL